MARIAQVGAAVMVMSRISGRTSAMQSTASKEAVNRSGSAYEGGTSGASSSAAKTKNLSTLPRPLPQPVKTSSASKQIKDL